MKPQTIAFILIGSVILYFVYQKYGKKETKAMASGENRICDCGSFTDGTQNFTYCPPNQTCKACCSRYFKILNSKN
jgi:hypothetical protein